VIALKSRGGTNGKIERKENRRKKALEKQQRRRKRGLEASTGIGFHSCWLNQRVLSAKEGIVEQRGGDGPQGGLLVESFGLGDPLSKARDKVMGGG